MTTALPAFATDLGHGVHAIDTGFHRDHFDAAYLVVERGRAAFIDTGTALAVPRLLATLPALGLALTDVDWVIPTHVHLDHAGGVGQLMAALPNATALVHPRGVRHMVDPRALWAGATAVYGAEEMARSYDRLLPVPAERVRASADGMVVELAGRPLAIADTPGHARHHHCVWDEATRGWFTGDTFGLSYREFDTARGAWIAPTSTPVQFEPEVLEASIERLLAASPACMYLTHFNRIGDVQAAGETLLGLLRRTAAIGRDAARETDPARRHERIKAAQLDLFTESLAAHGCRLASEEVARLLAIDLELNAQGIAIWLDRP
ncbi:MAG: MBL fold metallo-hydrolase [Rubrivivax sp.]|nr:MBL fold metallo-hydrolase [Rubrivivax sp.]